MKFLIWSIEHEMWWAPAACGYTPRLEFAGLYTEQEADEILKRANLVQVNECKIRLDRLQGVL